MSSLRRSHVRRLSLAILSAAVAVLLPLFLPPPFAPNILVLLIAALALNLWYGSREIHPQEQSSPQWIATDHQTAQRAADRVLSIQKFTEALSSALTIPQVAEIANLQVMAATGASTSSIMLYAKDRSTLEIIHATGTERLLTGQRIPLSTKRTVAEAARTEQPVWGSTQKPQHSSQTDQSAQTVWAAVPLIVNKQVIGVMEIGFSESQEFRDEDKVFILLFVQKCAQAIDRARLYSEVHEQRERLQVTLSSIGDAVITTDIDGCITFMNEVAETLTGWKFDATVDTPLHDVFRIISEVTRESQENPVLKVLRANTVVGLADHTLLIGKGGEETSIDDSGAPIRDPTGVIIGIIIVFRDISERRKRENALDATLQRTQDLYETCRQIGLVSTPGDVVQALLSSRYLNHATQCAILTFNTLWNSERPVRYEIAAALNLDTPIPGFAAHELLANSPLDTLLSRTESALIEDTQIDARLNPATRAFLAQSGIRSLMIFPLTAGRRCFGTLLLYFASPQHWSQEDHQHIQVFVDQICVTMDNVRLFAAEERARLDAEQADQIKLKFLAMISHELRTPLTSIKGFATTLLATDVEWDAQSQQKFIMIINDEADKLTDLISQLLNLSRLQAGKLNIQPEIHTMSEIIETASAQLGILTSQHQLVIEVPSDLPPIRVDMHRIAEVLVNLVSNAAKYSPPATQITISADLQGNRIQVNVSDEGPGIPAEQRKDVFEAFLQLDNASSQSSMGLGLGLAICKGLIEAHHGTIWIADGQPGTTVSFTLPIAKPLHA